MIKTTMTPSNSNAIVRLSPDGSATLLSGSVEIGQGTLTSLAQIVAEELGLPANKVNVTFPDTDVTAVRSVDQFEPHDFQYGARELGGGEAGKDSASRYWRQSSGSARRGSGVARWFRAG